MAGLQFRQAGVHFRLDGVSFKLAKLDSRQLEAGPNPMAELTLLYSLSPMFLYSLHFSWEYHVPQLSTKVSEKNITGDKK